MSFLDLEELKQEKKRLFEELSALSPKQRKYHRLLKMYISCFETLKYYQKY